MTFPAAWKTLDRPGEIWKAPVDCWEALSSVGQWDTLLGDGGNSQKTFKAKRRIRRKDYKALFVFFIIIIIEFN